MDELRYQLSLLKAMNQKISGEERMYRLICDTSDHAFLYFDFNSNDTKMLGKWKDFFEFEVKDSRDFHKIVDEVESDYQVSLEALLHLEKTGQLKETMDCRMKNGITWLKIEVTVFYDEEGKPTDKVIVFRNSTKIIMQNEELKYLAYYDSLTGLYNRNYFVVRLGDFLQRAEEKGDIVSVLFMDIDDFRQINDGMGLLAGDEIVQEIGRYLYEFQNENIIISRVDSDVYCMAIYDPCGERSVQNVYSTIRTRMKQGFTLSNGREVFLSVSIGVAEYPETAKTAIELINCAEIVMFKAKDKGKAGIQYFDAPILQEFMQNADIDNKLKDIVKSIRNFEMYFQPQYNTSNGRLRGVEALLRWWDEDGKLISPGMFIPVAEKNGTIVTIGKWVVDESLRCFAKWKEKYAYPMVISINISAIQYRRKDFVNIIMGAVQKYGIEPSEVELEITESILIEDLEEVKEKLQTLREYGIRISLDDFGTGFSSLSYLKGLPVDTLKIDKSFVDSIEGDGSGKIIIDSIVNMVSKLGFETVAEGIETEAQFTYLKNIGCDIIQGFLLGKPMPEEEIDKLLMKLL